MEKQNLENEWQEWERWWKEEGMIVFKVHDIVIWNEAYHYA